VLLLLLLPPRAYHHFQTTTRWSISCMLSMQHSRLLLLLRTWNPLKKATRGYGGPLNAAPEAAEGATGTVKRTVRLQCLPQPVDAGSWKGWLLLVRP
jgi:hypothetical protein